ncbi:polysaccharide deacetylase family protein [Heliobacterium gestii]|uniref:Polysaccharide deacetylase family protein n=1 Tax=Heliomicrobium gestii TaxID=2699 RepID=A0A845LIC2_HELGE|nr:polysaccharide deacetylase family protein [Heliomicrobium gestii]MBM7867772.1 peptidoglycan/xylan/chitin deacetylase (PgdA/CDA1 family) [Heliomicrobium gestii]MZP44165.1 polysaccharide deacetylase family protein [Heliomicrobium gestii]
MQGDGQAAAKPVVDAAAAPGGGQSAQEERHVDRTMALRWFALLTLTALLALLAQASLVNEGLLRQQIQARSQIESLEAQVRQLNDTVEQLQREKQRWRANQSPTGAAYGEKLPEKKTAYLTFDDGPSENTAAVLNILARYHVKATFFVNGNPTAAGKALYQRIVQEGHALGNHTYSHDYKKVYASMDAFLADARRLDDLIEEATGLRPELLRFPGGSNNLVSPSRRFMSELTRRVIDAGYQYVDWNVDSLDAAKTTQDRAIIVDAVTQQAAGQDRVIVLFHDSQPKRTTVEALPEVIERLQAEGYGFESLTKNAYTVKFL